MADLDRLTVHQLRVLGTILEERSVSAAARRLGVSQPALSHTLRGLRELLEDPLLVPGTRGMVATPRAEALAGPLRRILREIETLFGQAHPFDPTTTSRTFVLATWDGLSVTLLPALLGRIRAEAPRIDLDVRPVPRAGAAEALEDGSLDLSLEVRPRESPGLKQRAVQTDRFVCLVRADHPGVGDSLDLDTFVRLPHALISPVGEGVGVVDTRLAAMGLSRRISLRIRYFLAAPLIVARSDLILTAPHRLALELMRLAPLRMLEPPLPLPTFTVHMVWHERADLDPAHAWLRDTVSSILRDAEP